MVRKEVNHKVDPTASEAIRNIEAETRLELSEDYWRFHDVLDLIRGVCDLADFTIEERIVLKDNRTGKVWR